MTSGPASNASYRKYLRLFLEQDYAKRDSLLTVLSHAYPNPVDNLTTKPNLSYEELQCHMRELASNNQLNIFSNNQLNTSLNQSNGNNTDAALVVNGGKNRKRGKGKFSSYSPECTYCKKHGNTYKGHWWQECTKLKRNQYRKQDIAKTHENQQNAAQSDNHGLIAQAYVSSKLSNVSIPNSTYTWKFDTCASAHMTSDIGVYERIQLYYGNVSVGGGNTLLVEGVRSVLLNCILPNNRTVSMRLTSVLYIPSLCYSLVSWNVLKSKGCVIKASGDIILVSIGISGIPVLMAKFIGDIPFVMHTNHQSLISSTVPDHPTDTSSNKASEQPLNQLDNRASEKPLNQLNKQPTDTASIQVQK